MKVSRRLAVLGLGAAALAAASTPALASNSVNVSLTASGTRTLNLYEPDGKTLLTATDLSSGSSNFIAQVQDSAYNNQAFTVQGTMSNLYPYSGSSYNCNGTPIPSSAISLSSPSGLLTVGGVSAALTPVFTMSGQLTNATIALIPLASPVTLTGTTVNGTLPTTPISQSTLTGSSAANLFGSTLSSVDSSLPINLSTPGTGGAFTNPDVHPTCQPSVSTAATPVQMMHGAANPTGLVADLITEISTATCSGTALGMAPALSRLVCAGYLTDNAVSTALQANTTLMNDLGGLVGLTANLGTIEDTIQAPLDSTNLSLLSGATSQSGNYDASPSLQVKVPSGSDGTYKGVMTVTLVDGS